MERTTSLTSVKSLYLDGISLSIAIIFDDSRDLRK